MNRTLLLGLFYLFLISCQSHQKNSNGSKDFIYSVHGKMDISKLGISLTHEHVMSRFELESAYIPDYDKDSLFRQVIPYLKEVKALGVGSLFDCTTAYFSIDGTGIKPKSHSAK